MKMTESMKSEVVRLYFEENREEAEIAARLGISLRQAKTVLGDLARLETYKKRSEAAKLRAQICVNKSAEEAARRQAALLLDGEVNETISQRAAKDILDRLVKDGDAGEDEVTRAEKELEAVTKRHVDQIDELLKHKEAELLEV